MFPRLPAALIACLLLPVFGQSPYDARRVDFGMDLHRDNKKPVIERIDAGGPAETAGLEVDDTLLQIGETELLSSDHYFYLVHYSLPANQTYTFRVQRGGLELSFEVAGGETPIVDPRQAGGGRTIFRTDAEIFPELEPATDLLERSVLRLLEQSRLAEEYAHLREVLSADVERKAGFFRLDRVTYLQRNPHKGHRVAERLVADIEAQVDGGLQGLAGQAAAWLDVAAPAVSPHEITAQDPESLLLEVQQILELAHGHRERAFANLSQEDQDFLSSEGVSLAEDLIRHIFVDWRGQPNRDDNLRVVQLAKKVDFAALFAMAASLRPCYELQALHSLGTALLSAPHTPIRAVEGVDGEVLAYLEGPHGRLVVGGPGSNTYHGEFACIIDVGGDDHYPLDTSRNWPATPEPGIDILIDLSGDDRYGQAEQAISQGAGWMGAGICVDLEGDDHYLSLRASQGFAYLGFGLLLDAGGTDQYELQEMGQGMGLWGSGALVDLGEQDDSYRAAIYAQGLGHTRGMGLLVDQGGNDSYLCGGKYPSSYGTEGIFRGFGQGMGMGFRWIACGGVGLLLDRAGNDSYQAGNFSQGGGYFMALGVLADRQGDDSYEVTRYGQGFGCHSAVGVLLEGAGSDSYRGRIAANQGAAWDAGVGIFIESQGDDHYTTDGLSLGAGAQNGFGLFVDLAGEDIYESKPKRCLGHGGSNTYWWGRGQAGSIGLLLDVGGSGDSYQGDTKTDGATHKSSAYGLFCDLNGELIEILQGDPDVDAIFAERRQAEEQRLEELRLQAREAEASKRLEKALRLIERERLAKALKELRAIAEEFPECDAGTQAEARVLELESDPEVLEAIAGAKMEAECKRWLSMGTNLFNAHKMEEAAAYFQQIIDTYPDSSYAAEARSWLEKLRK